MTSPEDQPAEATNTKTNPAPVLVIAEDADETAISLSGVDSLADQPLRVEWVTELSTGIERLGEGGVGAAVLDLNLPGSQGIEAFDKIVQAAPDVPVLILSESGTAASAKEAVQQGAQDYLIKDKADGYRLRRTVRSMIDRRTAKGVALENEIASATLNSIGLAVLRTDRHGNITYLNRFAEKMTGWLREQALGRPVANVVRLIDSNNRATFDNGVKTVLTADRAELVPTRTMNCTLVRRDGVEFGIVNRVTSAEDASGNVIGAVLAISDVSALRGRFARNIARGATRYSDQTAEPNAFQRPFAASDYVRRATTQATRGPVC